MLHHCARLERRADLPASRLDGDEDLFNAVLMDLQQAIQGCIDLAIHVCVDERLGAPAGPAEAFSLLAGAGRIAPALGQRLAGAAGLRDLIVHRYAEVESARVLAFMRETLGELVAFVRAINP